MIGEATVKPNRDPGQIVSNIINQSFVSFFCRLEEERRKGTELENVSIRITLPW